ncbi:hypothetical protein BCO18442_06141 [Burkholderia contaminans]|nr:hypothetical protein BCO18442_06141 [Burkholderia contaminans]
MTRLVEVGRLDPHLQQLFLARAGRDRFLDRDELARDQREQVARLAERVFPFREVAAVGQVAGIDEVAVRQQHRVPGLVGAQRHRVRRHHVRAVEEVGDAAETFGFALREEVAARHIKARQRRILVGCACAFERQLEGIGNVLDGQPVFVRTHGAMRRAVQVRAEEFERFAHQLQVRRGRGVRIAAHAHRVPDDRAGRREIEFERDGIDEEGRRRVVGAADHGGRGVVGHGRRDRWSRGRARGTGRANRAIVQRLAAACRPNFLPVPGVRVLSASRYGSRGATNG